MRIGEECGARLFKHSYRQFATDGRKIIQEDLQRISGFQVIEERLDRDARANENGRSAVDLGIDGNQLCLHGQAPARATAAVYATDRSSAPNAAAQRPLLRAKGGCLRGALRPLLSILFASPGSGTAPHLTGENLLRVLAKLGPTAVHFRGAGPTVAAVVAGEPEIGSMAVASPLPHLKSGRLRALGVSSAKRLAILPDVPTFVELGYRGVQDFTWIGVFLPAGTPAPVVQRMNEALNRAVQSPDVRERLEAQALDPVGGTPQQFADYVKAEIAQWGRIVQETGSKPD